MVEPDKENWGAVEAIVLAGGHVNTVNVVGSTLEDVYLKLVIDTWLIPKTSLAAVFLSP